LQTDIITVLFKRKPAEKYLDILKKEISGKINLRFYDEPYDPQEISILVSGRSDRSELENLPNLKHLIFTWAGIPDKLKAYMPDFPNISIHNLHHNAIPVAENTLALLLTAAKFIIPPHNALAKNDWRPRYQANHSQLLHGKNTLILGFGSIGKHVAKLLKAFNMTIMATRMSIQSSHFENDVEVFPTAETRSLLKKAGFLIITLPLTDDTENLIGEEEIDLLPKGAILVNIGRGKILNQKALYKGLTSGKLGAAAIDVWYNYPDSEESRADTPPSDYPLHELDNIVMSPHRAGGLNASETERLRMLHLARLLNHAAEGKDLPNKVDLKRGY